MIQCNKAMDAFLAGNNNRTFKNDNQMDIKCQLM